MEKYTDIERQAIVEIGKTDIEDFLTFGPHYFGCGWRKKEYYNYNYAVALSLIGFLYGDKNNSNSYYHKGVSYIANELEISKRMVKILRKRVKYKNGYWFKTPYATARILQKIIDGLHDCEQQEIVCDFLGKCNSTVYREILLSEQFASIKAASSAKRKEVVDLANDLRNITIKVGDNI